ncbi:putative secreted protein [Corynebacterium pilosum]|uniref:Putative secreted protein n=1 Tax=Corynebacterium pilosum TaxID=35756 RepID=A0A376CPS1_9CORY|nr:DUF4245 domain-containing protein [Corynebacterium pilosum]STC70099.1 putative secreted protein [Corynebacterium pilosum]
MPVAEEQKPRIFQGGRDILISMGVLLLLMFVAVGFTGMCTFNPGAPESGPVKEVDAKTFTEMEARGMNFPVRYPEMGEGWMTNSARRAMVSGEPAPVVGWVTPNEGYVAMTQTGVDLDSAVRGVDSDPREYESSTTIAGHEVQLYTSEHDDVRDLRVVDMGDSVLLFTGAGSDEEFHELIDTAVNTEPIDTTT